jgi:hypothetical protein
VRLGVVGLLVGVALVAGACRGTGTVPDSALQATEDVDPAPCSANPTPSSERSVTGSALAWMFGEELPTSFDQPTIGRDRIVAVLSADGIPAIDEPRCLPTTGVGFLEANAPILVLEVGEEVRGYPLEILTWHELVNDTVGGMAVTVSYCPLCNSAIVYDRTVDGVVLDFGTSGALTQSSMVMYDRQTESLWTHFNGQSVAGELTGTRLEFLSSSVVAWRDFRAAFPEASVLSRDTGFSRNYGRNPYPGYEDNEDPIARFITDDIDPRLAPKTKVLGIDLDGQRVAVAHSRVFERGVAPLRVADRDLVAFNRPGTASALEGHLVSGGDDVGASAVFESVLDGELLSFTRVGGDFVDDQTGSTWDIFGDAISGPMIGRRLERVPFLDTFWFSWSRFHPDTTLVV